MNIPGFTSTGSKRPEALFGPPDGDGYEPPSRMTRASGCQVWDADGREYTDFIMALGAVALGYGHPAVDRAAVLAIEAGTVGPLPPVLEERVAQQLGRAIPTLEAVRFLKTGAEAVAAAVRLARIFTGRDQVLGCGYHGWLDWCHAGAAEGIPSAVRAQYAELPYNEVERARAQIRRVGDALACVVVEPVVVHEAVAEWFPMLRAETERVGAVLILDEIKTAFRLAIGGGAERYGIKPDLMVLGKALANGFPLAAVGGRDDVMAGVKRTWISSTLATESVALAAAEATIEIMQRERVPAHLAHVGGRLLQGLEELHARFPGLIAGVAGLPEMCFLKFQTEALSARVARECAGRGLLFKRSAYNFVSLAHTDGIVDNALDLLDEALTNSGKGV